MEKGVLRGGLELGPNCRELDNIDPVQAPAVGIGHFLELVARFGERDVKGLFARQAAGEKELQRERGFSRARFPFEQVKAVRREAAAQNIVQPTDARGAPASIERRSSVHWRGGYPRAFGRHDYFTREK